MPGAVIRCPFPFPDIEATTYVEVYQEVDTKYEGPQETLIYDGMAVYDRKSKTIFSKDSKMITLSGKLIIKGEVQVIDKGKAFQGFVKIGDEIIQVHRMSPGMLLGQVFTTEIDLL